MIDVSKEGVSWFPETIQRPWILSVPPERLLASLQTYANSAPFQGPASHGWARDELGRFIPVQLGGQTATQGIAAHQRGLWMLMGQ